MDYGGPVYSRRGAVEVGFGGQRDFIGLYILRQHALATQRVALAGLTVGKRVIRHSTPEKIDHVGVRKLLVATRRSKGPDC
jgi:hypothetical protein